MKKISVSKYLMVFVAFIGLFLMTDAIASEKFVVVMGQSTIGRNDIVNTIVPKHLGYFKQEGLDVEFQTSAGGTQAIQLLTAGHADIGLTSVPGIILARQKGMRLKGVYNYLRKHATSIAVLADGEIKDPKQLKGKKIGVVSMASTRTYDGRAMVKTAGLDPAKDVEWVPVGFGAQAASALTRGDVSALVLWDATYTDIENLGIKLKYFTFPFQKDLVGFIYMSTDEKVENRREALIKFLRGVTKGLVFSQVNPNAATCIYFEATDALKMATDKKKSFEDALNVSKNNLYNAELPEISTLWGSFPEGAWEINQKYYKELGVVGGELPASDYYITDSTFYKKINEFDRKKVEEEAKNYKCKVDFK